MHSPDSKQPNGRHWHVVHGLRGGYLPDGNDIYPTKRDALRGAQWTLDQYRESGEAVAGRAPFWIARKSESLEDTYWDYVEVTGPCFDDCDDEG